MYSLYYWIIDCIFMVTLKIEEIFGKWRIKLYSLYDDQLDKKYGIDTKSVPETTYIPLSIKIFREVFKSVSVTKSSKLFDYGSGKGKAFILASELGIQYVGGVEWSSELVEQSKLNIEKYRIKSKNNVSFNIIHGDATLYEDIDEYNIFLFNNTFGGNPSEVRMIAKVLKIIQGSLSRNHREIFIIYVHPAKNVQQLFDSYEWLKDRMVIKNKYRPLFDNALIYVFHVNYGV